MVYSWRLFLYLLKKFGLNFFFMSAIGGFLIFILDVTDILRRASNLTQMRWSIIMKIAILKLPFFYDQILPFIILFTALFCLWSLNRSREIMALKANGASFRQILIPLFVGSFFIACFDLSILNPLSRILWARQTSLDSRFLQQQDQQFLFSEQGIWTRLIEKEKPVMYRIGRLNRDSGEMSDIMILRFYKDGLRLRSQYHAEKGAILDNGKIYLKKVWVVEKDSYPNFLETLVLPTEIRKKDLEDRYLNPRYLSIWKIWDLMQLLRKSGLNSHEYVLHLNAEIARVFWMMTMIFVAGSFMMRPPREGRSYFQASMALFFAFGLYVLKDFLYALGLSGRAPIVLAAWVPVVVNYMLTFSLLMHYEDG